MGHDGNDDTLKVAHAVTYVFGNIIHNFRRELKAIPANLVAQDVTAKFDGRLLQFGHHAPFEARDETFLYALQQYGRAVGSEDELFTVLMQVVEDVEERVLRLRYPRKFLYVVNDEHVNGLVEVDEVIDRIVAHRVGILHLKQMGGHVEHPLIRIQFFDFGADGVHQMRLAHARCPINEQRVEDGLGRIESYGFGHAAREFVAFSLYESFEVVVTFQVRIQLSHQRLLGNFFHLGFSRSSCRVVRMRG